MRETFKFAVESCVVDPSLLDDVDPKLLAWHRRKVDLLLSVLGMHECADTIAGNAVIRGMSGGQKKRLTIGEFMITNSRVLLLDEPTTGLDAAVARDIMVVLRKWCGISGRHCHRRAAAAHARVLRAVRQRDSDARGPHRCTKGRDRTFRTSSGTSTASRLAPDVDIADWLVDWLTDPTLVYASQRKRWNKKGGPTTAPSRMTLDEEEAIKRNVAKLAQSSQDEAEADKHNS